MRRVTRAWVAELETWTRRNRVAIEAYHAQWCPVEGCGDRAGYKDGRCIRHTRWMGRGA